MAHTAASTKRHLTILKMKTRVGKQSVITRMVIVHMRNNDVFNLSRINAKLAQTVFNAMRDGPATLTGHGSIKSGINHNRARGPYDGPDKIVNRHRSVVWISPQKVIAG